MSRAKKSVFIAISASSAKALAKRVRISSSERLRSAPIEQFRLPIDGTSEVLYYMNMATQQIDYPANRQALQDFLFNSGYTVREDTDGAWD